MKSLIKRIDQLEKRSMPGFDQIMFFDFTDKTNAIELETGHKVTIDEFGEYEFYSSGKQISKDRLKESICFIEDVRE